MYNAWLSSSSRAASEIVAESNAKKTLSSLIGVELAHAVIPSATAANRNLFIFFFLFNFLYICTKFSKIHKKLSIYDFYTLVWGVLCDILTTK